jgi:hypothetical protein
MLNSANFKVSDDEFNKIASLIEKISAIEYISNGNLSAAMEDIYGKREAIFMITMSISDILKKLTSNNVVLKVVLGDDNVEKIIKQRNLLGHDYDSIKPHITMSVLKNVLPEFKEAIKEHIPDAYEQGIKDFNEKVALKKEAETNNLKIKIKKQ